MKIPRGWSSLLPPSSHCQKRTHLGFRGDTALRGQWRMPRRLFCRRFYFVSVKERKVKQSQSGRLATPGGFLPDCGDFRWQGTKAGEAIRGEKGGAGGANSPPTHHCCQPKVSLRPRWATGRSFQTPHAPSWKSSLPKKERRKIKPPKGGSVNSISLNTRLYS